MLVWQPTPVQPLLQAVHVILNLISSHAMLRVSRGQVVEGSEGGAAAP